MRTRITEMLGIEHPIVQTGMGWVSGPRLTAATSNAGGLGILIDTGYKLRDNVTLVVGAVLSVALALAVDWLGALADFALGRYPEATALVLDARELARANGQEDLIREHLAMLAVLAAVAGDRDTALAHLRELREHVRHRETAPSPTSMIADWALSVVDLIDGNVVRAFHRLDRLAGPLAPPGHQIVKTALFCYLVEAAAKAGETDDVFGPLARFETWTRSTGNPGWTALACRSRALVTEDDAEADEESGKDVPPEWTVQPEGGAEDKHA